MIPELSRFMADSQGVDPAQLEQMWKLLDDMAASNPKEYDKLVTEAKQDMQARREEESFVPDANFVVSAVLETVETQLLETKNSGYPVAEFFVNICTSDRCLAPHRKNVEARDVAEIDDCAIPVSLGERRQDAKGEKISVRVIYDVVVHPLVAAKARRDERFKRFLALLVLERALWVENRRSPDKPRKFRENSVAFPPIAYKAGKKPQLHCIQPDCDRKFPKISDPSKQPTSAPAPAPAPAQAPAKPLIEEVASSEEISVSVTGGRDWAKATRVTVENGKTLRISVSFLEDTEISSAIDIEEKPTTSALTLFFGGYEPLEISDLPGLPRGGCSCRVSKKLRTLDVSFDQFTSSSNGIQRKSVRRVEVSKELAEAICAEPKGPGAPLVGGVDDTDGAIEALEEHRRQNMAKLAAAFPGCVVSRQYGLLMNALKKFISAHKLDSYTYVDPFFYRSDGGVRPITGPRLLEVLGTFPSRSTTEAYRRQLPSIRNQYLKLFRPSQVVVNIGVYGLLSGLIKLVEGGEFDLFVQPEAFGVAAGLLAKEDAAHPGRIDDRAAFGGRADMVYLLRREEATIPFLVSEEKMLRRELDSHRYFVVAEALLAQVLGSLIAHEARFAIACCQHGFKVFYVEDVDVKTAEISDTDRNLIQTTNGRLIRLFAYPPNIGEIFRPGRPFEVDEGLEIFAEFARILAARMPDPVDADDANSPPPEKRPRTETRDIFIQDLNGGVKRVQSLRLGLSAEEIAALFADDEDPTFAGA